MYLNIVTMSIFSIELVLNCYARKDYFNSFFFWLDLISTLSVLTDIEPVWSAIIGDNLSAENEED